MSTLWSRYVQTTEELYVSRDIRFREDNKDLWLQEIGVKCGGRVLEVGCGGGVFCHKLKKYVPSIQITGVDLDSGHIAFARDKAKELGLECQFVVGDIASLPFEDDTFDLCFSYTVSEHVPPEAFYTQQRRVLKEGGRLVVLSVRPRLGIHDPTWNQMGEEEQRLLEKAWSPRGEKFDQEHHIGAYALEEHAYPKILEQYGFHDVQVSLFTVVDYAPDNALVSEELALQQIESQRTGSLACAQKVLEFAPDALTPTEQVRLKLLIHARFDRRIEQYRAGEKLWDFSSSTALAVSGIK